MPTKPLIPTMPPSTPTPPVNSPTPDPEKLFINSTPDPEKTSGVYNLNVLIVAFIPLKFQNENPDHAMIDDSFFPVGGTLSAMRARVEQQTQDFIDTLEYGSHGTVTYRVKGRVEIQEKYPLTAGTQYKASGYNPPLVDYPSLLQRVDISSWGIDHIWLFGPQIDGEYSVFETLMSSKWGNISNSDRLVKLPTAAKSYILLFFNVDRGISEVLEAYMHQVEFMLEHVDNLANPNLAIKDRLFWGKFCGCTVEGGLPQPTNGVYRCGWSHCQPNSRAEYDWWLNTRVVQSDFFDWKPDGGGATTTISRETFNQQGADDGGLGFKIAWLRALPRNGNTLTHNGKNLTDWWRVVADWDGVMSNNVRLSE